jgi:hypothetical protein
MESQSNSLVKYKSLSRGINYVGALGAKLRDLQGFATLAFELIQNADDAPNATQIRFAVSQSALVVENDGQFSDCGLADQPECLWRNDPAYGHMCDFHRFREVSSGDKREQLDTAGAFGVGFTAVYQITDRPELVSHGRHWIICEDHPESQRILVCPGCGRCSDTSFIGTLFYLPWALDPDSGLRQALRAPAVAADSRHRFIAELKRSIPEAMLFLKQLNRVEVFDSGNCVAKFERVVVDSSVLINDGESDTTWHIVSTDFDQTATTLRAKWGNRIEKKRTARVRLAIPIEPIRAGLLCAYLPTQHETGLPFHINADFFTQSDRKTVILESDFQSEWNRTALGAAALALATHLSELPTWLGTEQTWRLVDAIYTANNEALSGKRDSVFKLFWESIASILPHSQIAECTDGTITTPSQALMVGELDESDSVSVLAGIDLNILCPELRQFAFRLPGRAGVQVLDVHHIATALHANGLSVRKDLTDAPQVVRHASNRSLLFAELERLLTRKKPPERIRAIDVISNCAVFLADDGALWPAKDIYRSDSNSVTLISKVCSTLRFSTGEAHQIAPNMALAVPQLSAAAVIGSLERDAFTLDRASAPQLLRWFESRKGEFEVARELRLRLAALPVFPCTAGLKSLQSLALAGGGFVDPVGITDLVELGEVPSIRAFLIELGARELTFERYAATYLPRAIRSGAQLPLEKVRSVVELLAARLGEIRDNSEARSSLASLEIIECSDGRVRRPAEVYFSSEIVNCALGSGVATATIHSTRHKESIADLYRWLGVAQSPRLEDVAGRIAELSKHAVLDGKLQVEEIVKHLGERLRTYEYLPTELQRLQQTSWLPARGATDRWFKPSEVYVTFREYLFSTQAKFLDLSQSVQRSSAQFLRLLGMRDEPTVGQVVAHLLACSTSCAAVNREVYGFLNEHASDQSITLLRGKPCLMLADGKYIDASHVFWNSHPFGRFRTQLAADLFKYSDFLNRVGVRLTPTSEDALAVLREISSEYGSKNAEVDDHCHQVVMVCWTMLTSALESGELSGESLVILSSEKVIPAPNGILERPTLMFFEDRAGLASKFPMLLANNVIRCPEGAWRAMLAAGVRFLTAVVSSRVVDVDKPTLDTTIGSLFNNRRTQLARVLDPVANGNSRKMDLDILGSIECFSASLLLIQFSIEAFKKREMGQAEEVKAYFDAESVALYFVPQQGNIPWAAIAREISAVLCEDTESGRVALALMQVLSAPDTQSAGALLDELGFPPVENVDISPESEAPVTDLGTEEETVLPPSPTDTAQAEESAGGAAPNGQPGGGARQGTSPSNGSRPAPGTHGGNGSGGADRTDRPKERPQYAKRSKFRTYVVPEGAETTAADGHDGEGRSEVDEAGVQRVCEYEISQQRNPTIMPHNNPGFDIKSTDVDGIIARYIEVKSSASEWGGDGVAVSKTQFEDAKTHGDVHWLYVVEKATSADFRIFRIQDPAGRVTEFLYDDGWSALAEPEGTTSEAQTIY